MSNTTPNQREVLYVKDSVTKTPFPVLGNSSTGAIDVSISSATVSGGLTNNNAAPSNNNLGVLPAIANAAAPTYTEGDQVLLSTDLSGAVRITGSISVGGTTDNSAFTAGSSTGTAALGFYHSTIDTVTDGHAAAVGITSKRAMLVNLQNASGTEIGTSSNPINVKEVGSDSVDSNNSTTATLLANASYTGTGTSTIGYSYIEVYVYSDQSSAASGFKIEFSSDNTNWDDASTFTFTAGGSSPNDGQTFGAATRGQYYRVVYTNGSVNQTAFRLQSVLRTVPTIGDMVTMSTVPNSTNHATLTKSSIVGLTTGGGGGFVDVKVNPSGTLTVDASGTTVPVSQSGTWTTTVTQGTASNLKAQITGSGSAGTADSGVVTIQGIASMTPVQVSQATAANLNATVVGTGTFAVQATLGAETTKVIGVTRTADGSGNLLTSTGNALDVNIKTSAASNISTNLAQVNGATTLAGNGTSGTGAQRVTIASDSTGQVAPAANSAATGTAIYNNTALSSTKQAVNASAGNLYGYHIYNPNSAVIYVQLFNLASASVTVGSTAPTAVLAVPAGGWADAPPSGPPIAFGTALTIAATTTSTGSGTPTTALLCNMWYK